MQEIHSLQVLQLDLLMAKQSKRLVRLVLHLQHLLLLPLTMFALDFYLVSLVLKSMAKD